ncbi:hypothetical protein ACFSZS_17810 [Seohaeicola zhoushanensis]
MLGLEPLDGKKSEKDRLTEARRDLLSSVAGEIEQVTGGRTMDRILRRCQEDLDALATGARLSPKGAFKETEEARKALEAELAVLEQQCSDLAEALAERRRIEGELQRLDDPAEKARRESDLRRRALPPRRPKAMPRRLPPPRASWTWQRCGRARPSGSAGALPMPSSRPGRRPRGWRRPRRFRPKRERRWMTCARARRGWPEHWSRP